MKKNQKILLIVLAVLVVLFIGKNMIIKAGVETAVKAVTGLNLKIGHFNARLIDGYIKIENLKLYNPKGFADREMLSMPQILIDCEPSSLLSHLRQCLEENWFEKNM